MAAVAPSGHALASLITAGIDGQTGPVLELGPGTGVFTRHLIARGVREENLVLVERSASFAHVLARRYPRARVVQTDATLLADTPVLPEARFGAVVCGLGLIGMPESDVRAIVSGAVGHLRPEGSFSLFTYASRCSVPPHVVADLGLHATKVGQTWRNLPPASVYRLRRKSAGPKGR